MNGRSTSEQPTKEPPRTRLVARSSCGWAFVTTTPKKVNATHRCWATGSPEAREARSVSVVSTVRRISVKSPLRENEELEGGEGLSKRPCCSQVDKIIRVGGKPSKRVRIWRARPKLRPCLEGEPSNFHPRNNFLRYLTAQDGRLLHFQRGRTSGLHLYGKGQGRESVPPRETCRCAVPFADLLLLVR